MKEIDYDALCKNIDEMVNLMEYDGMRSPGKIKINAQTLSYLLVLKKHYAELAKPAKKAPTKEA